MPLLRFSFNLLVWSGLFERRYLSTELFLNGVCFEESVGRLSPPADLGLGFDWNHMLNFWNILIVLSSFMTMRTTCERLMGSHLGICSVSSSGGSSFCGESSTWVTINQ